MNSSTHDYSHLPQTFHPHERSIQHQQHTSQYRCSHINKGDETVQRPSNFQPNSVVDYPYVQLNDQHIRDLTDVYRREKDFLEHENKQISCNETFCHVEENFDKVNEEFERKSSVKEYYYNIPCNCETSLSGKIFQKFINRIKISVEFFLFMGYAIGRRNELLERRYPFDRSQSYDGQVNYNYPFVHRSTYNNEIQKLNTIRNQLNKKRPPIKHTTTSTYYDIH